jgi:hypothetical protein
VYYFIVETRGFTLEEIAVIFDTPDLTWKQRRNMKPPSRDIDSGVTSSSDAKVSEEASSPVVDEKRNGFVNSEKVVG